MHLTILGFNTEHSKLLSLWFLLLGIVYLLFFGNFRSVFSETDYPIIFDAVYGFFVVCHFVCFYGLWLKKRWTYSLAKIFLSLLYVVFPVGTWIGRYGLKVIKGLESHS